MNSSYSTGQTAELNGLLRDPAKLAIVVPVATLIVYIVFTILNDPLSKYPGPAIARWTNLWRLFATRRGRYHLEIQKLHEQYGPIVRIGPNLLDLDMPELVKTIFNIKGDWKKTEFYHASSAKMNGHIVYNMFSQTDRSIHAAWKKPIAKYYSMNGVLPLEPHVDSVLAQTVDALDARFATTSKPAPLDDWVLYFGWDVVGSVTFSKPIGYLENGSDFNGVLNIAEKALDYFAWVGAIPVLDHWFDKNPVYRIGPPSFGPTAAHGVGAMIARLKGEDSGYHNPSDPDFLDNFLEAKKAYPDLVDDNLVVSYLMNNLIAGADTTAISLRNVFYYVLRSPRVWQRLRDELKAVIAKNPSEYNGPVPATKGKDWKPVTWKQARASPYLEAVMRESLRMLPGVSMQLERYVPSGGMTLPGFNGTAASHIPADTIVGLNPYIIGRNKSIYGEDAEEFRPERWLQQEGETEAVFQERLMKMNNADLTFGAGSRICIGKHLAVLEAYKFVATMVMTYDMELSDKGSVWKVTNSWFPRQKGGLDVQLKRT